MQVGDIVVTSSDNKLFIGEIEGPCEQVDSEGGRSNLRRDASWKSTGTPYSELPAKMKSRIQVADVVDMTSLLPTLEELVSTGKADRLTPPVPVGPTAVSLKDPSDDLAGALNVDRAWLQETVDLLRDRPQTIFYGPPGTGKTYIAKALAEYLAGDNVRLVQFHPAYSYEDFFEGYRPTPDGKFELKPGPFRKTVDAATENPTVPYFLIIDEINRGNLAKIFGELYFLLEYRDEAVDLLYQQDDDAGFSLPDNVFIIGTMNTADRSIALVDAAMRRRFSFVQFDPSEPPVDQVLRRWLVAEGRDPAVADLLDALNSRIDDPDFRIGPSYFMRPAVHEPGGLERTWRTAILPLLEEHHYGEHIDIAARYGLDAVRAAVHGRQA